MKTRGQCYYFCYDTHSFNNLCVHILTAGIHVLAFQRSICPLIKADIIPLPLIANSARSRYGSSLQSDLRESQHGRVVNNYRRGTRDTKETFSAWPQCTEVSVAGQGAHHRFSNSWGASHSVDSPSFLLHPPRPAPPTYLLSTDVLSFPAEKIFPVGVSASVLHFYRSFFFFGDREQKHSWST